MNNKIEKEKKETAITERGRKGKIILYEYSS